MLQRAIIFLFSTDWLSKSRRSVYCAVRTGSCVCVCVCVCVCRAVLQPKRETTRIHSRKQITSPSSSTEVHLTVFQTDQTAPLGPFGGAPWDLEGPGPNLSPQARYPECSVVSVTPLTARRWQESRVKTGRDGTRAETRFGLPAKRTSPFISAGVSVQSSTGFLGVRVGEERL